MVTRLIRISFGDYQLQTIPPGMAIEVPVKPIHKQVHRGPLFSSNKHKHKHQQKNNNNDKDDGETSSVRWIRPYQHS